jgi:hypothetical protein
MASLSHDLDGSGNESGGVPLLTPPTVTSVQESPRSGSPAEAEAAADTEEEAVWQAEATDADTEEATQQGDAEEEMSEAAEHRDTGQCDSWHAVKGWGFVKSINSGVVFFCHNTELRPTLPPLGKSWYKPVLYTGQYVEFTAGVNKETNEPCCLNVTGIGGGSLIMDHGILKYLQYRNPRNPPSHKQDDGQGDYGGGSGRRNYGGSHKRRDYGGRHSGSSGRNYGGRDDDRQNRGGQRNGRQWTHTWHQHDDRAQQNYQSQDQTRPSDGPWPHRGQPQQRQQPQQHDEPRQDP